VDVIVEAAVSVVVIVVEAGTEVVRVTAGRVDVEVTLIVTAGRVEVRV
jgi:hypothetical protein